MYGFFLNLSLFFPYKLSVEELGLFICRVSHSLDFANYHSWFNLILFPLIQKIRSCIYKLKY